MKAKISEIICSVGAITFFAYVCTFAYYEGCFSYYGIPKELLKIDINSVLRFTKDSLSLLSLIFVMIVLESLMTYTSTKLFRGNLFKIISISITVYMVIKIIEEPSPRTVIFLIFFVVLWLMLLFTLWAEKKKGVEEKRYIRQEMCAEIAIILCLLYAMVNIAFDFGESQCRKQTEYFAINGKQDEIILQESDGYFIVGKYNEKSQKFEKNFQILNKENQEIKMIEIKK